MAPSATSARNLLTLEQKMEVIKMHDQRRMSSRAIAREMGLRGVSCGKTQIQSIVNRKRDWIDAFERNVPLDWKTLRKSDNDGVNGLVYEWFKDCSARLVPMSGQLLQQKARDIARELGINDFKASNGWLAAFQKRRSICFKSPREESGATDGYASVLGDKRDDRPVDNQSKKRVRDSPAVKQEVDEATDDTHEDSQAAKRVRLSTVVKEEVDDGMLDDFCRRSFHVSLHELASIDQNLATSSVGEDDPDSDSEDDSEEDEPRVSAIKDLYEFAAVVSELKIFAVNKGLERIYHTCTELQEELKEESVWEMCTAKQTTLLDYFKRK